MENNTEQNMAAQSAVQMRKGMLMYCVLLLCQNGKIYTSEIISALHEAELIVVEGTLYPLLNRLAKDKFLDYEWQESEQGPPRKYYWLSESGRELLAALKTSYHQLHSSVHMLEKQEKGTKR